MKKQLAAEAANVAIADVVKQIEALGDDAKVGYMCERVCVRACAAGAGELTRLVSAMQVAVLEVDVGGDSKMLKSVMSAAQKAGDERNGLCARRRLLMRACRHACEGRCDSSRHTSLFRRVSALGAGSCVACCPGSPACVPLGAFGVA